jgi:TM2 domain-containing membrane protein YozV
MDCVNHSGVSATAYCQNCGKALCAGCLRNAAGGQLLCEPCWRSWQSYQQPFVAPPPSGPNPAAAAVLGLIPGVGAMYNGQFFKGFIHVIVFAVLISITSSVNGIFGIFIAAWVFYQSFEAFHTAKAMRDGQPVPDPFGLNEVGNWLNLGQRPQNPGQPGGGQAPADPAAGAYQPPYAGQAPNAYQAPYTPPAPGFVDPNVPPSVYWRRKEPIGAIVLIGLGILFLLAQLDVFHGRLLEFTWPLFLIALGVWLFVRRLGDSQGGPK